MKQQIEKLIDQLACKEFSFGGNVKIFDSVFKVITADKKEISFLSKEGIQRWVGKNKGFVEPLGHPILIGDVLEKINQRYQAFDKNLPEDVFSDIIDYWMSCGFAKSLQTIFAECEWEEEVECECGSNYSLDTPLQPGHKCAGHRYTKILTPTQQPHKDLFQFLLNLNLDNE